MPIVDTSQSRLAETFVKVFRGLVFRQESRSLYLQRVPLLPILRRVMTIQPASGHPLVSNS
jgi:hypothetical protein